MKLWYFWGKQIFDATDIGFQNKADSYAAGGHHRGPGSQLVGVSPAGLWALVTLYIPIMSGSLSLAETWAVAAFMLLLVAVSLFAHLLVHFYAARGLGIELPQRVSLLLFGDSAQAWPAAGPVGQEALVALLAMFTNILLAGLSFLVWNAQLNLVFNLGMLFASFFNLWVALINLIPGFPFAGHPIEVCWVVFGPVRL